MSTENLTEASELSAGALHRSLDRLSAFAIGIAALALVGLVIIQGWQVYARYILNDSPSWTEPVTLLLLSTAMSLGAATGVRENRHFGFFLLADALGPRAHRAVDALVALVIIAIGAVLAWWSAELLLDGWDIRLAGAPLPQSINYLPMSLGGALMVLFALERLRRAIVPQPNREVH